MPQIQPQLSQHLGQQFWTHSFTATANSRDRAVILLI